MAHCIVPAAEKILDRPFKVLNKGFVRLVDYMGSDERIVAAARVSYAKGTKTFREDAALIDYLLRNDHTSPFEQVVFAFHVKMPIFRWRGNGSATAPRASTRFPAFLFGSCRTSFTCLQKTIESRFRAQITSRRAQRTPCLPRCKKKCLRCSLKTQKAVYKSYTEILTGTIRPRTRACRTP